jgi:hypothetical protein
MVLGEIGNPSLDGMFSFGGVSGNSAAAWFGESEYSDLSIGNIGNQLGISSAARVIGPSGETLDTDITYVGQLSNIAYISINF